MDTQGLLLAINVLEASLGDREGSYELLLPLAGKLPRLQLIWVDSGYASEPFMGRYVHERDRQGTEKRLVRQLSRLGYHVELQPVALAG